ncbi:MAG: VWA domain-containing protein [Lachnospiraceae bacterium]|nr:VWA domain-containing protein [Lachnospiraceae bacterium]
MRKGLTEVVFILDRSGSMSGLEADTIGGYNSMLKKQKSEEGEVLISTVLFDDRSEVLHDRKKLESVDDISEKDYYVRGCTALLDALGGAIHHISKVQKEMPAAERPEKTLFIITTDGMENASRKYTYEKVKKMVEKKKEKSKWEFIFLGANIDAIEVAGRFGVAANRAVRYECDGVGTALNFDVMSKMVSCARASESAVMMGACLDESDALEDIRRDYKERHKA